MPEVSVVIPTFNSARFLDEALQSILDQSFKDYEIIVVDDGSTDQTKQVVARYGDKIKYILQENSGPAAAKNNGIRNSSGKYIAFLDADDMWLPTKLEKQVKMFRQHPELAMVFTENVCFNEGGIYKTSLVKRSRLMNGDVAKNIFLYSGVATPTVMVRKEIFDRVGLFEEKLYMAEDDNMWVRIAAKFKVALIDEPLVRVRTHPQRATTDKKKLFEMVQTNIHLLSQRSEGVKERLENVIPLKLSQVQFSLGYHYFENCDFKGARKAFAKGISCYRWNWRNYLYLLLSFLPKKTIQRIKQLKNKVLLPTINSNREISYFRKW
jgi:glycosyltransferase involved in cell wall biosynthesis